MKTIPGFPHYKITENGKVFNVRKQRFLKGGTNKAGYKIVGLVEDGIQYCVTIHCLVLLTYKGNPPLGTQICHNNGIKTDNRLENLRWDTPKNNMADAKKHKVLYQRYKTKTSQHLSEFDVRMIVYVWRTKLFTIQTIASWYNISKNQIRKILNKQAWKWVWIT